MLTLAYEGTCYCGWQIQPNGLTVQECVERGIEKLTGTRSSVLCAGRTDSGVHALGQVASFKTASRIPVLQIRRGLQSFLPFDVVVLNAQDVSMAFHATWSAVRKTYRYVFHDGEICPPFLRHLVSRSRRTLDVGAMQSAAQHLLGTHDFRCFESHYPNKQTSVRTIERISVTRQPIWAPWNAYCSTKRIGENAATTATDSVVGTDSEQYSAEPAEAPVIVIEVTADGFLYNMVRAIAGTLQRIGEGKRDPCDMAEVISSMDRATAGMTAAPSGLYLVQVEYPAALLTPEIKESRE